MSVEKKFLEDLDRKLWSSAEKLRSNAISPSDYMHIVLGLIFLKYVSDAFEFQEEHVLQRLKNPQDGYYYPPEEGQSSEAYEALLKEEIVSTEDYFTADNILWIPEHARWSFIKTVSVRSIGDVLWQDAKGQDVKFRSVSWLIDNAFEEIEQENPKLKGVLKSITSFQIENETLLGLINTFSDTSFTKAEYNGHKVNLHSKDILGHVYEYFLGKFAIGEGKRAGQFYTPKSIVTLFVEMLEPYHGRVYDPAMGTGGFFVSSSKFIENHAKEKHYNAHEQSKKISIYGQEANPTTWNLAKMNMVMRGLDYSFGKKHADSFLDDQHPSLQADYVMANPPFNIKEWWSPKLEGDVRWKYGTPPEGNANFAWLQHMLHHLAPTGTMALLLANGSMSSNTNNEGVIRKNLVEADLVECMVALPGQLFTNTQIPACIWFLTKDKSNGYRLDQKKRNRSGELLFIDARNLGYMKDRVLRDFADADIAKITDAYHAWQMGEGYEDEAGFCYSASLADIQKNDFVLTPGRYVGTVEKEDDAEPFPEKMARLTETLKSQFEESHRLEAEIAKQLAQVGFGFD